MSTQQRTKAFFGRTEKGDRDKNAAQDMSSSEDDGPVGVALFGMGRAGLIHFRNLLISPRVRLRYIVELDVNKATDMVERYHLAHDVKVLPPSDTEQALKDPDVDAVVVCAPTFAHEEIVRSSLQRGKAVFCEKPISEDTEGTKTCYEEAQSAGKPLLCSFNRRFDPSVRALRNRVRAGEVGHVHTVRTCSRDSPLPPMDYLRISGGIFHDCAVHDIDMVCWILDEYPCSVFTLAHSHNKEIAQLNDVDTVAIVMKFPSGVLSTVELSRNASYGYDQRLEVFGSEGMVVSENQRPCDLQSYGKDGHVMQPYKYSFPQRYADSYVASLDHFIDVIHGKAVADVTKQATLNVSIIASACEESHHSGQPVSLSLSQPSSNTCTQQLQLQQAKDPLTGCGVSDSALRDQQPADAMEMSPQVDTAVS